MKKRLIDLRGEQPLLDIVSYGRSGPRSLTRTQREYVARTARRTPEVVIKVSGGARTLAGVERNLRYIARDGDLGLESDTGENLRSKGFEADLIRDWNLDLEARTRSTQQSVRGARKPSKLVHNLIFSMPPGTPPDLLLKAVRKLARHQFGERHRHAMVLHTDEPHPHVHVVVKAVSEQGERLNIRKATLREWRQEFAANLRELGVSANATERAVRGANRTPKRDGVYRTEQRHESTYIRERADQVASSLARGDTPVDEGKETVLKTRRAVVDGWRAVSERLHQDGHHELAAHVDRFIERMPPVRSDTDAMIDRLKGQPRERTPPVKTR